MRIQIHDDNQNFLNWGNLVLTWIRDKTLRPTTVGQLKALLTAKGITATVDGPDTRGVEFWDYPEGNDPIQIALPRGDAGGAVANRPSSRWCSLSATALLRHRLWRSDAGSTIEGGIVRFRGETHRRVLGQRVLLAVRLSGSAVVLCLLCR
jgi:hypothetical protein